MIRKLHTLLFIFFSVAVFQASAQRNCASFEHLQQQLAQHPELSARMHEIEQFTRSHENPSMMLRGTPVYTIPVVVHVLWNTSAQNISDAQIQSQIDALNKDYQLLNADSASVPNAFKSFVADCQIQFCLAQRDPNGAATSGIVRKQTSKTSFNADTDDAKSNSTGGDNAWNASKYLNLWVVPDITSGGSGGILGYAQFPGGAAATDGVVIGYKYFGTTGTVVTPFNKGRTATHEVGHWLNLRHIWGDEAACAADDLVGDTPKQADKNFGCPAFPKTDACTAGNGVMFMNYMDYTDDACMYMFTIGQKSRMYGVLQAGGARASITSSDGCVPVAPGTCSAPGGLATTSITSSSALISWSAVSGAVSYSADYKPTSSSTWISATSGTTSTSVNISGLSPSTAYDWRVLANCSSGSSAYGTSQFTTTATSGGCVSTLEPNETLAAAALISVNTAVSAAISSTTDKDWYKFTLSATSNLNITLTNLAGDYDIILYNSAGTEIKRSENGGTTNETISNANSAAGTYYLQVFGYNGANSSTICYNLNAGASTVTTTCPGSYDVSTNGTTSGSAQIPLNTDIKGLISPSGDIDYYRFVITTGGTISLSLTTLPGDYDIRLYNSAGTQVAISQNGGTSSETINYTAGAGTYYARIYGYNGANSSTVCYTLKVSTGTATRLETNPAKDFVTKVDIYPNPADKVLTVAVSDYEGKAMIRISDMNGRILVKQQVSQLNNTVDIRKLAKGIYFVQVITEEGELLSQKKIVRQ